jgi:pimeloyl-ACP methyl ester carboxylesterase
MRLPRLAAAKFLTIFAAIGLLYVAGCAATGPMQAQPADYVMPGQPATQPSRMGRVYVLRGFGDVFSVGMNAISAKLEARGVISTVHRHDQWQEIADQIVRDRQNVSSPAPLVLIGHSWGADDSIRIARTLAQHDIRVDLLVTVEAVTPPAVPSNVLRAWNIYKPGPMDFLPWWRGVPVHCDSAERPVLTQIDISRDWPAVDHWWLGHSDVDNQSVVQDRIVDLVMAACPVAGSDTPRGPDKPRGRASGLPSAGESPATLSRGLTIDVRGGQPAKDISDAR